MDLGPLYLIVIVRLAFLILVTEADYAQRFKVFRNSKQPGQNLTGRGTIGQRTAAHLGPAASQTKILRLKLHESGGYGTVLDPASGLGGIGHHDHSPGTFGNEAGSRFACHRQFLKHIRVFNGNELPRPGILGGRRYESCTQNETFLFFIKFLRCEFAHAAPVLYECAEIFHYVPLFFIAKLAIKRQFPYFRKVFRVYRYMRHAPNSFRRIMQVLLTALMLMPVQQLIAGRVYVFGTVRDENGQAVELATVNDERTMQSSVTGLKGKYGMQVTPTDDTLRLVFRMIGHETRRRQMAVSGDTMQIDMVLPTLGYSLGGVDINSTRRQTDAMQEISTSGIRFTPQTGSGAVESIIATQAGVSSHNELSSQYSVRGGNFDENSVYVNGTEIFRPQLIHSGQQEGLSFINPDMTGSIRFSTGGFGVEYQDRTASVLDITYRRPERFEYHLTASLLGGSIYLGTGNDRFSISGSVRYKTTTSLLGTLDTKGEYDPRFLDFQTFACWTPGNGWDLSLTANSSRNRYSFSPTDRTTSFGTSENPHQFKVYFEGWENDIYNNSTVALDVTKTSGNSRYRLNASLFGSGESESYDILSQYWIDEQSTAGGMAVGSYMQHARNRLDTQVASVSFKARHSTGLAGRIDWGLEYRHDRVKDHSSEWEMRDSAGYTLPYGQDIPLSMYSSLMSDQKMGSGRVSAYVQDTYRLSSSLGLFSINGGIRTSWWSWNSRTTLSPRMLVSYQPSFSDALTFRLSGGVYHQSPFYKEFKDTVMTGRSALVMLNRDIRSQRSLQFVLGGDYDFTVFGRAFKFTTELYYKKLDRLIPYTLNNVRIDYQGTNSAHGYATGIDMKLFGEFVPGTPSWLTFSLMDTKECVEGRWRERPTSQRYSLSLYFTDAFPRFDRWNMSLRCALADGLPFSSPSETGFQFRAPAYRRVDIGLSYKLVDSTSRPRIYGRRTMSGDIWIGADCLNLIGVNNVNSYYWISDVLGTQYAVPNYLTGRQLNFHVSLSIPELQ